MGGTSPSWIIECIFAISSSCMLCGFHMLKLVTNLMKLFENSRYHGIRPLPNLDGIMSAEGAGPNPFRCADDLGKEKELSMATTKSEAATEPRPKPASNARGRRAAFSRSKSFNLDGKMSEEGAGPKPFTGAGENGSGTIGESSSDTKERSLPTRSQSSKGRRSASSSRKPMSRASSFDDTGNNPMQLK